VAGVLGPPEMSTALEGSLFNYFAVVGASSTFDTLESASHQCTQNHPAGVTSAKRFGPDYRGNDDKGAT
jgi:hypothetical protein